MHHVALDGPGTNDRHLDNEVVITTWPKPRQHRHLCARFDLEDTHRIAVADHVVYDRVLGRHRGQRVLTTIEIPDQVEAPANRRQHAETQHIDLQKTEVFQVILLPLDNRAVRHRRVFDGYELMQRRIGNDKTTNVLRQVPWKTDQLPDEIQQALDDGTIGGETRFEDTAIVDFVAVPPLHRP